jgi:hypothetical protein
MPSAPLAAKPERLVDVDENARLAAGIPITVVIVPVLVVMIMRAVVIAVVIAAIMVAGIPIIIGPKVGSSAKDKRCRERRQNELQECWRGGLHDEVQ